jgi:hypothetical protein
MTDKLAAHSKAAEATAVRGLKKCVDDVLIKVRLHWV